VVVDHGGVVPTAPPRVPSPAAAVIIVGDRGANRDADSERDYARNCHVGRRVTGIGRNRGPVDHGWIVGWYLNDLRLRGLNDDGLRRSLDDGGLGRS